jgi:hypothetical protein
MPDGSDERFQRFGCLNNQRAAAAEMGKNLLDQSDGLARLLQDHFGEQSVRFAGEFLPEPDFPDFGEGEAAHRGSITTQDRCPPPG